MIKKDTVESGLDLPGFVCTGCKNSLIIDDDKAFCPYCRRQWKVKNGILNFLHEENPGHITLSGQTNRINQIAIEQGWIAAAHVASEKTSDPNYQFEYITNDGRADFRFLMPVTKNDIVLDLGSGWGTIASAFSRECRHIFAVDVSIDNLEFIKTRFEQEKISNFTLLQADATEIPLPQNSIDAVLMVGVLEWVAYGKNSENPRKIQAQALSKVNELLVPGGCLYIGIENRFSYKYFLGIREPHNNLRFVSLLPYPIGDIYSRLARKRKYTEITYSYRGLLKLLKSTGYKNIKIFFPIPGYQIFRYITDYQSKSATKYMLRNMRSHPKFSTRNYYAATVLATTGLHRYLAPSFSVLAFKG